MFCNASSRNPRVLVPKNKSINVVYRNAVLKCNVLNNMKCEIKMNYFKLNDT